MRRHLFRPAFLRAVVQESPGPPLPPLAMKHWLMNCYLELSEADRQGDQSVFEEIQVLEVDQAAEVGWQLLQFVLAQVQLHQVCEATEIRLGPKREHLSLGLTHWRRSPGAPNAEAPTSMSTIYQLFHLK